VPVIGELPICSSVYSRSIREGTAKLQHKALPEQVGYTHEVSEEFKGRLQWHADAPATIIPQATGKSDA